MAAIWYARHRRMCAKARRARLETMSFSAIIDLR
jgi:hypothetical protein